MRKIRGIKPDYWTDEDIVELSLPARLLFIGLWNLACDNGHLDDKPKQIKMRILPVDDVDVDALLDELAWHKRIERKTGTITIPRFAHHQKPHTRWWVTCDLPDCKVPEGATSNGGKPSPSTPKHSGTTVAQPLDHRLPTADGDGDGDGDGEVKGARKRPATHLPQDWKPTDKHWEKRSDAIDVAREAEKFRLHAEANDRRQVNWNAAFSQWLLNARPSLQAAPAPLPHASEVRRAPSGLSDEEMDEWLRGDA